MGAAGVAGFANATHHTTRSGYQIGAGVWLNGMNPCAAEAAGQDRSATVSCGPGANWGGPGLFVASLTFVCPVRCGAGRLRIWPPSDDSLRPHERSGDVTAIWPCEMTVADTSIGAQRSNQPGPATSSAVPVSSANTRLIGCSCDPYPNPNHPFSRPTHPHEKCRESHGEPEKHSHSRQRMKLGHWLNGHDPCSGGQAGPPEPGPMEPSHELPRPEIATKMAAGHV